MKAKICLIFILLLSSNIFASSEKKLVFKNYNEGKSFYFHRKTFFGKWNLKRRLKKFKKEFPKENQKEFISSLKTNDILCEENFVKKLMSYTDISKNQYIRRTYYLYILRESNYIDDIALRNYLYYANIFSNQTIENLDPKKFPGDDFKEIRLFALRQKTGACFFENSKMLFSSFKNDKKP